MVLPLPRADKAHDWCWTSPSALTIRHASRADAGSIAALAQSLGVQAQIDSGNGFIIDHLKPQDYARCAASGDLFICLHRGFLLGFVLALPLQDSCLTPEQRELPALIPEDDFKLRPENTIYVKRLGVSPAAQNLGVGSRLYRFLYRLYPQQDFLAAVCEKPLRNSAAAAFHVSLGFRRIAAYRSPCFLGQRNYQSGIYVHRCPCAGRFTGDIMPSTACRAHR